MKFITKPWLKAAAIRALRTFGQVMASSITIGAAVNEVDWMKMLSISAVAAIYSIFTSISGLPEVNDESEENK